jgi:hypothetical protein
VTAGAVLFGVDRTMIVVLTVFVGRATRQRTKEARTS